ncbi:hypothetical protein FKP32DRAFT_1600179 [Trametes sanguinea]|nr:hypothetical protein FKP32DRAFT_1600179 [Trametes sanguinea]
MSDSYSSSVYGEPSATTMVGEAVMSTEEVVSLLQEHVFNFVMTNPASFTNPPAWPESPFEIGPGLASGATVFGGTIAPHEMHLHPPHDTNSRCDATRPPVGPHVHDKQAPAVDGGLEDPSSLAMEISEDNKENVLPAQALSDGLQDVIPQSISTVTQAVPQEDEEEKPIASQSLVTLDIQDFAVEQTDADNDPLSSGEEERPAKRQRRTAADLEKDEIVMLAEFCGLGKNCKWRLKDLESNRKHVRTVHYKVNSAYTVPKSPRARKGSSSSRIACLHNSCKASYRRMQDVQKHIESKHWKRRYKCDECQETFTQRGSMTRHKGSDSCKEAKRTRAG